ncbi:hypothetical protein QL285_092651 [Trifolium repens]|nr:hypothetical protein QL285_092651 [Trifolium repens]
MATYLLNILPSKTINFESPLKMLYQKDPSYSHLRVFGCLCYPLFPSTTIHKLQPRSSPCVFLGYPSNHRGYKCLDLSSNKIIICRHVIFDENTFPYAKLHTPQTTTYTFLDNDMSPYIIDHLLTQTQPDLNPSPPAHPINRFPSPISGHTITNISHTPDSTNRPTTPSSPTRPSPPLDETTHSQPPPPPINRKTLPPIFQTSSQTYTKPVTRSQHNIFKPNQKYYGLHTQVTKSPLPKNPVSALQDPNWKMAMDDEYNALIENKTWDLVPRPPDVNVIRSMWIFRHKERSDGSFERHKARLVGDGTGQQVGIDCGETFSPVVKPATIRTVLSIALSKSWHIHQLDVKNAFLHGELKETVYMYQPLGFKDSAHPDHVCRLRKSLYGLKQAPRAFGTRDLPTMFPPLASLKASVITLFLYTRKITIWPTSYFMLMISSLPHPLTP